MEASDLCATTLESLSEERGRGHQMQELDAVNDRWGRGVLKVASGKAGAAPRAWRMKQDSKSPDYTTSWEDMPTAKS